MYVCMSTAANNARPASRVLLGCRPQLCIAHALRYRKRRQRPPRNWSISLWRQLIAFFALFCGVNTEQCADWRRSPPALFAVATTSQQALCPTTSDPSLAACAAGGVSGDRATAFFIKPDASRRVRLAPPSLGNRHRPMAHGPCSTPHAHAGCQCTLSVCPAMASKHAHCGTHGCTPSRTEASSLNRVLFAHSTSVTCPRTSTTTPNTASARLHCRTATATSLPTSRPTQCSHSNRRLCNRPDHNPQSTHDSDPGFHPPRPTTPM